MSFHGSTRLVPPQPLDANPAEWNRLLIYVQVTTTTRQLPVRVRTRLRDEGLAHCYLYTGACDMNLILIGHIPFCLAYINHYQFHTIGDSTVDIT